MSTEQLDYFSPGFIMAFIMAAVSDFAFVFAIAAAIPVIGLVFLAGILAAHYIISVALAFLIFPKVQHFLPKLILGLAILIPAPLLTLGIVLAAVLQNKYIRLVTTQAAIIAIGAATGGAGAAVGEAAEAGAVTAEAGTAAIEAGAAGAETAGNIAEGVETFGEKAVRKGGEYVQRKLREDTEEGEEEEEVGEEAFGLEPLEEGGLGKVTQLFEEIPQEQFSKSSEEDREEQTTKEEEALEEQLGGGQLNQIKETMEQLPGFKTKEGTVELHEEGNVVDLRKKGNAPQSTERHELI